MMVAAPRRTAEAIVSALTVFPDDLARALEGREMEALLRPSRDGGWGVVEILPHLRDWEEIFLDRVKQVLAHETPALPAFDDDLWAIERDYRGQDPLAVLAELRSLRDQTAGLLNDLPSAAWERTAVHGTHGEISLRWMMDHVCDHDYEHLEQVRDALA